MIISQTPLRISFVGGGTDLPSYYEKSEKGCVLSTTIDKYIYVIVKSRYDDAIVLNYSTKEIVNKVSEVKHDLIREAMIKAGITKGIEITTIADIPSSGSGLGSSSSLTVGLLNALYQYVGINKNNFELAEEACEIEIKILGNPIGKQDQYAAAFGGLKIYNFLPTGNVDVEKVNLALSDVLHLESQLFLVFTNITRNANEILSKQNTNTKNSSNTSALDELAKMPHILKKEMEGGNFNHLGKMLKEGWELKKKLASGIDMAEISDLIDLGLNNGAIGGKILGAGGGGFVLFYVPDGERDKFKNAVLSSSFKLFPIRLERFGSRIIMNFGRSHHMI